MIPAKILIHFTNCSWLDLDRKPLPTITRLYTCLPRIGEQVCLFPDNNMITVKEVHHSYDGVPTLVFEMQSSEYDYLMENFRKYDYSQTLN